MNSTSTKSKEQSTKIMTSYGTGKFLSEFFAQAFGVVVFKYYETEVHLVSWLAAIAFVIYSVWNAVNDPLIGYITEKRTTRLSAKFGRRFPWIMGGAFIWVFTFILIFAVPTPVIENQIALFIWMVISICLFDTLYSLWDVNYQSLFPDKFRTENNRNKAAGIATGIGVLGIALGFIMPSLLTEFNQPETYVTNSIVFAIIGFFLVFLLIPGVKESPDMIERYFRDRKETTKDSFIRDLKSAFKERNFIAWIVLYFFYQSAVVLMTGSIQYVGDYILPGESADTTIIFVGLLGGALIAIPLWLKLFKRIQSNQKMMMVTALLMATFAFPLALPFVNTYELITIFIFLFGLGFGGYWMIMTPALADVIDEIVLKSDRRNDGIFMGFRAFFGRFAFAVQAISFWLVHELTQFDGKLDDQLPLAVLGIHIHLALIPAILLILGVIVFWRLNTLNPEIVANNKKELSNRGL
ncbi:MAG: MFS transporter [Candidatus Hodarchaeales archaeon]|jgi:GPH family glycoside/pentoside/hexuronide:cation symporter